MVGEECEVGETLVVVSSVTWSRAVDNVTTLFRVWPLRFQFCQRY